jgi:hypothetical protein
VSYNTSWLPLYKFFVNYSAYLNSPPPTPNFTGSQAGTKKYVCAATEDRRRGLWVELAGDLATDYAHVPRSGLYFDASIPASAGFCNINPKITEGGTVKYAGEELDLSFFIPLRAGTCVANLNSTYMYNFTITNRTLQSFGVNNLTFNIDSRFVKWKLSDLDRGTQWDNKASTDVAPTATASMGTNKQENISLNNSTYRLEVWSTGSASAYSPISTYIFEIGGNLLPANMETLYRNDIAFSLGTKVGGSTSLFFCNSNSTLGELGWKVLNLTDYNSIGIDPETKTTGNKIDGIEYDSAVFGFATEAEGNFLLFNKTIPDCTSSCANVNITNTGTATSISWDSNSMGLRDYCELHPEKCKYCTKSTGEWRKEPIFYNPGFTYSFDYYLRHPTFLPTVQFSNIRFMNTTVLKPAEQKVDAIYTDSTGAIISPSGTQAPPVIPDAG